MAESAPIEDTEPPEGKNPQPLDDLAGGSLVRIPVTLAEWVWLVVVTLLAAGFCVYAVNWLRYGFDFTDEGFYLLWISSPEAFPSATTWFGFAYHPLYVLVDGNIFLLRVFGCFLTVGLAWWLAYRTFAGPPFFSRINPVAMAALGAGVAIVAPALGAGIPTPHYYTLTVQGLLLTSIGLSYVWRPSDHPAWLGWVLIGLGLLITFMAKPPTAAAAGLLIVLALLVSRSLTQRGGLLAVAVTSVAGLLAALVVAGSPAGLVKQILSGLGLAQSLGAGHTLAGTVSSLKKIPLMFHALASWWGVLIRPGGVILLAGLVACTALAVLAGRTSSRTARIIAAVISGGLAVTAGWVLSSSSYPFPVSSFQLRFALSLSPFLVGLIVLFSSAIRRWRTLRRDGVVVAALFAALPFAVWFGTPSPMLSTLPKAAVFWALSGLICVVVSTDASRQVAACIPVALLLIVSAGLMIVDADLRPLRKPAPLMANTKPVQMNRSGKTLLVEQGDRLYIESLRAAADTAGFEPGTAIIDLTGQSPGSVYVLGGAPPVTPWLLGGYPGSRQFAEQVFLQTPCSVLARAWVLSDEGGSRRIDSEVLGTYGADIARDFENVGVVAARDFFPLNRGNLRNVKQSLWRPLRDPLAAEEACDAARSNPPVAAEGS